MLRKKALAERIGIAQHTIVRWELCQTEPTPDNVTALVRELDFPKAFFFGDDLEEPLCQYASFRSQRAMSASERDAALAAGAIAFMISTWVSVRFELPAPRVPDLHLFDPESAAQTLRQEWALGEKPISNMIQLLESKGVRVFSLFENTVRLNAFSLWRKEIPHVFLNTRKSAESSRFDAAHELGHLVLHQDGSVTGREAEDQANRFASSFLLPKSDILAAIPKTQHIDQLITAKRRWRVSLAALNYRLHKLGITSDWKNRDFCIEIAKRGYNTNEPQGIERETSVVWQKVLRTLWAEGTTHFDIANELNLPASEVSGLLFGVLSSPTVNRSKASPQLAVVSEGDNQEQAMA